MSRVNVKEKKEGDKEIFITIDKLIQIDEQNERKKSIDSWRLSFRDSPEAKEFVQKCQEIIKSEPKPDQSQWNLIKEGSLKEDELFTRKVNNDTWFISCLFLMNRNE